MSLLQLYSYLVDMFQNKIAGWAFPSLYLGKSGTAGELRVYPSTASKGYVKLTKTDNAGDTATTITVAAQAAARTYTVPDAGAAASFMLATAPTASGLPGPVKLPLMLGRTNTGLVMDATGGAGLMKIGCTPGTGLNLISESAQNNTKTDYVCWEFQLPPTYKAASNLTVEINASHAESGGTTLTNQIDVEAWEQAGGGTQGADICATAAQAIGQTNLSFTLTGTNLVAGDVVLIRVKSVATEGGNTGTTTNYINSVQIS